MSNDEELSSKILTNISVITHIYSIVKEAGLNASLNPEVVAGKNNVTIIKANVPGLTRITANCRRPGVNIKQCRVSSNFSITYDANDITIIVGAALNVYDYTLKGLKERHSLEALENYIKKKTSDIDIVWWPRESRNIKTNTINEDEIVTSSSPAIKLLVDKFQSELIRLLDENKIEIENKIRPMIPEATNEDKLIIEVGGDKYSVGSAIHTWQVGSIGVVITLKMKTKSFKICEVIIHDSGASQLFDENGLQINTLLYMTKDPVYSSPNPSTASVISNSISYLNVNSIIVAVPNILSFVRQQMLAFSNNMERYMIKGSFNYKGFINYKRVEFIKKVLQTLNVSDEKNKEDLLAVFNTTNINYPKQIVENINTIENYNIKRLKAQIITLCGSYNTSADIIIAELCEKAKANSIEPVVKIPNSKTNNTKPYLPPLADIQKSIFEQIAYIELIKTRIIRKEKNGPTSHIRRAYQDLYRAADHLKVTMIRMTPDEMIKSKYYYTSPIVEIEKFEHQLDLESDQARKKQSKIQLIPLKNTRSLLGSPPLPTYPPPLWPPKLPPEAISSEITQSGVTIYYSEEGYPWYYDTYNQILMRNPYSGNYEVIGIVYNPPPHANSFKPEYDSMAQGPRPGNNKTYKKQNSSNTTRKNK